MFHGNHCFPWWLFKSPMWNGQLGERFPFVPSASPETSFLADNQKCLLAYFSDITPRLPASDWVRFFWQCSLSDREAIRAASSPSSWAVFGKRFIFSVFVVVPSEVFYEQRSSIERPNLCLKNRWYQWRGLRGVWGWNINTGIKFGNGNSRLQVWDWRVQPGWVWMWTDCSAYSEVQGRSGRGWQPEKMTSPEIARLQERVFLGLQGRYHFWWLFYL